MSEIIVKVKYFKESELIKSKIFSINNKRITKYKEFMDSLRTRFKITSSDELTLEFRDDDDDAITVDCDDEFRYSLNRSSSIIKFELINKKPKPVNNIKANNIKAKIKYPDEKLGSGVGDCYEVVFDSKYLAGENKRKGTDIWGTDIYTSDSDYLKALIHSKKIKVTKAPSNDIIATFKILPGRKAYTGTYVNGIKSLSYGNWDTSFIIENYRYDQ